MSKYYITVSEFHSMLEKLNSMDDYDSMLIYAPEYHKLAEISCVCHDVYGKEVHLVETPFETVLAVTQIPDEFIELPKKKEGTDTKTQLKDWLDQNDIAILTDAKNDEELVEQVDFKAPVSRIVKFLAQYFPQLNVILN